MIDDDMDFTKPQGAPPAAGTQAPTAPATAALGTPVPPPVAPAKSRFYDAVVALKLFKAFGKAERFKAGEDLFMENEKAAKLGIFKSATSNKMFFIEEGEVSLSAGGRVLDTLRKGEIFGEMSVVSGTPRSATATAKSECVALSLDAQQFQTAIQQIPEFALMLMSVMFDRLRLVAARLATRKTKTDDRIRDGQVFDAKMLEELLNQLDHPTKLRAPTEKIIMREGEAGITMYVVLSGRVGIIIKGTLVESVGPGGTFGEMALVDQSPRTAAAFAQTDCELLAINRAALLQLVKEHPVFAMAILKAVADRLRYMNSMLN